MTTTPEIGAVFPAFAHPADLPAFAADVEAMGYDSLWVIEDCFLSRRSDPRGHRPRRHAAPQGRRRPLARRGAQSRHRRDGDRDARPHAPGALHARVRPRRRVVDAPDRRAACPPCRRSARDRDRRAPAAGGRDRDLRRRLRDAHRRDADHPPDVVPPVLVGTTGPPGWPSRAGTRDGFLLPEGCGPAFVTEAVQQAAAGGSRPRCEVYAWLAIDDDAARARASLRPAVADWRDSGAYPHAAARRGSRIRGRDRRRRRRPARGRRRRSCLHRRRPGASPRPARTASSSRLPAPTGASRSSASAAPYFASFFARDLILPSGNMTT